MDRASPRLLFAIGALHSREESFPNSSNCQPVTRIFTARHHIRQPVWLDARGVGAASCCRVVCRYAEGTCDAVAFLASKIAAKEEGKTLYNMIDVLAANAMH